MACPEGLEPPTYCLEGNCSIRLSYGQLWCGWGDCAKGRHHTAPVLMHHKVPGCLYGASHLGCGRDNQEQAGTWPRLLAIYLDLTPL